MGNQIHIPLHRPQQRQRRAAIVGFRLQIFKSQATSSLPKRAHPARQAHQPLGRGTASRPQAVSSGGHGKSRRGGVNTGISRRSRHPSIVHLPATTRRGARSFVAAGRSAFGRTMHRPRQRVSRSPGPSHAFAESRAKGPRLNRKRCTARHFQTPPNPRPPRTRHPRIALHPVGAHPPCSRKGPLLPAGSLNCHSGVKRETTNSRFFIWEGLGQNFGGQTRRERLCGPETNGSEAETRVRPKPKPTAEPGRGKR
jgi:hypothetical protein